MATSWTPEAQMRLLVLLSASVARQVLIGGTMIGVLTGSLSPHHLGTAGLAGTSGGLVGFGVVLFWIIRKALTPAVVDLHHPSNQGKSDDEDTNDA